MMARRWKVLFIVLLLHCAVVDAGDAIPPEKRIGADIVRTIRPPATQPFRMPTAVAADSLGRAYVADGAQNRIVRFSPDGQMDLAITELDGLKLNRPAGICVDAADALWIADTGNHRIVSVSAAGKLLRALVPPKLGAAKDFDPSDLAVQTDRQRLRVVDKDNQRILILNLASGEWSAMGSMGTGHSQFQWPFMICSAPKGYVYVTDVISAHVHRISANDRWAGEVGGFGIELGQFYRPKGVVADTHGRLFVSDSTMGVVQVFDSAGTVEGVLCDADGKPLRFEHPMGMCLDRGGRLYVVELIADRVAVVSLSAAKAAGAGAATAP